MEVENGLLEDYLPLQIVGFPLPCDVFVGVWFKDVQGAKAHTVALSKLSQLVGNTRIPFEAKLHQSTAVLQSGNLRTLLPPKGCKRS